MMAVTKPLAKTPAREPSAGARSDRESPQEYRARRQTGQFMDVKKSEKTLKGVRRGNAAGAW
jgi:hypothetical protein